MLHALNFPEILGKSWTTVLYLYNIDIELWISLMGPHNFSGSHNSISAICKIKDVFIWLRIEFLTCTVAVNKKFLTAA